MTITECDKSVFMKSIDSISESKHYHNYYFQCQGVLNLLRFEWIDIAVICLEEYMLRES